MTTLRINTPEETRSLRESGRRLARIMDELIQTARPGLSTLALGQLAETLIREANGDPIFKGYGKEWGAPPFPAAVCLSINDEVVHGIPSAERILRGGDLLKIDIGMRYDGMVTDMARTVPIGEVAPSLWKLATVTAESLAAGIATLRDGMKVEAYATAVETRVKQAGFSCVRDLVGHGVGHKLHEDPQIPNYSGSKLPNFAFRAGMSVALEPMVNVGKAEVRLARDGWTFVTADGSLSAHCEDTVLITEEGSEVVTRPSVISV